MTAGRIFQGLLLLCYPVLIFFGLQWLEPRTMAGLLALTLVLRKHRQARALFRDLNRLDFGILIALLLWTAVCAATNNEVLLRLYPAAVSIGMLVLFGTSLVRPPTMVQRFAMLSEPNPTPQAVLYMRRVTQVWCVFFVLNALAAVVTAFFASRAVWAFYNGFAVYLIMGALFAGEWVVRRQLMGRPDTAGAK